MHPSVEKWLRDDAAPPIQCLPSANNFASQNGNFTRYSITDLIQQECCTASVNYPVDKPSNLVKIECRKPGCRCVLKHESALAVKIVTGVTIIQGRWTSLYRSAPSTNHQRRVILTSCSPAWFELLRSTDANNDVSFATPVPVWSDCSSVCQARPSCILLRRKTACLFATDSVLHGSLSELVGSDRHKQVQTSLDVGNVAVLPEGTVLQVVGPRLCQLSSSSAGGGSRHPWSRSRPTAMLQCTVVGARALADVAASLGQSARSRFAFNWMAQHGCRPVYLPLDTGATTCSSPVAVPAQRSANSTEANWLRPVASDSTGGLYSALALLSQYRLPVTVRPTHTPPDWLPADADNGLVLEFESCHHGDLVFLEPIGPTGDPMNAGSAGSSPQPGRFFVVTPDMLQQHCFFQATDHYSLEHVGQLEAHAHRVAHFLTSLHPADGLTYLVKHLEDVSQIVNTGPSHLPVTRTLGPVSPGLVDYTSLQSTLASCVASAAMATGGLSETTDDPLDGERALPFPGRSSSSSLLLTSQRRGGGSLSAYPSSNLSSTLLISEADQMNALCDELDDIYYYVRNGRLPNHHHQSLSMTSLGNSYQHQPAALSPQSPRVKSSARQPPPTANYHHANDLVNQSKHPDYYLPRSPNGCAVNGRKSKTKLFLNQFLQAPATMGESKPIARQVSFTNSRQLTMRPPVSSSANAAPSFIVNHNNQYHANDSPHRVMQLINGFDSCRLLPPAPSVHVGCTASARSHLASSSSGYHNNQPVAAAAVPYWIESAPANSRHPHRLMTQSAANLSSAFGRPAQRPAVEQPLAFARHLPPPSPHHHHVDNMSSSMLVLQPATQLYPCQPVSLSTATVGKCRRKDASNSSPDTGIGADSVELHHPHHLQALSGYAQPGRNTCC